MEIPPAARRRAPPRSDRNRGMRAGRSKFSHSATMASAPSRAVEAPAARPPVNPPRAEASVRSRSRAHLPLNSGVETRLPATTAGSASPSSPAGRDSRAAARQPMERRTITRRSAIRAGHRWTCINPSFRSVRLPTARRAVLRPTPLPGRSTPNRGNRRRHSARLNRLADIRRSHGTRNPPLPAEILVAAGIAAAGEALAAEARAGAGPTAAARIPPVVITVDAANRAR